MTSEDGNIDAQVEELAASAKYPQEDVAEVPANDETETPAEETAETETDTDALSDTDLSLVDRFSKFSEAERNLRIQKLLSSGRQAHTDQAKMLMEALDLEVVEDQTSDVDEAVAKSLEKMGLTQEEVASLKEEKELKARKTATEDWGKQLGIDPNAILKSKEFVKAYHTAEGSTQGKVDVAIKAYLAKNPVTSAAKKLATLKLSETGGDSKLDTQEKHSSLEDALDGKTLEEIDLSKL